MIIKKLILFVVLGITLKAFAQDIDFYIQRQNDKFNLPTVNWQMSFDEFQILSRTLRMQDMLYAMIVPGYAHFYIKEKTTGYILLTTRLLTYSSLLYTYYFALTNRNQADINQMFLNMNFVYAEIGIILGTYFYDWIHAKYLLQKKQELIRYKYSIKLQLSAVNIPYSQHLTPMYGVMINF